MSMLSSDQRAQEEQRAQTCREELVERIVHALAQDGSAEPLRGLFLFRASRPTEPLHGLYEPAFCVVAQGSKEVLLGDDRFRYDPAHYLLATVGLPTVSHIVEASRTRPYLSLRLSLDLSLVSSVMLEAGYQPARSIADARAMACLLYTSDAADE